MSSFFNTVNIFDAVLLGDVERVTHLLKQGANINAVCIISESPLTVHVFSHKYYLHSRYNDLFLSGCDMAY